MVVGRERLRELLHQHDVTFQRTKTWKETNDPNAEVKLARIEEVSTAFPDRVFAFDEFGPLAIRPHAGAILGPSRASGPAARATTTSCTVSGSSTPATASATTPCGASCAAVTAQRREHARIRSGRQRRWGQTTAQAAA
nr:hypothetical protein GCM10020063_001460 [Dactylosporangium thailandense]